LKGGSIIQEINVVIDELLEMDPKMPDRQFEAAISLANINDEAYRDKIIDALIQSLNAPQALVRAHSAEALGRKGDPKAINYLIKSLSDPYYLVRSYSARALGELGGIFAVKELISVMENDKFFGCQAEAAKALGKICPNETDNKPLYDLAQKALEKHQKKMEKSKYEQDERVKKELKNAINAVKAKFDQVSRDLETAINEGYSDPSLTSETIDKIKKFRQDVEKIGFGFV